MMDRVAAFSKKDREHLFTETAGSIGNVHPIIVEKDFWVVWLLKHLYQLEWGSELVFRGHRSRPEPKVFGLRG